MAKYQDVLLRCFLFSGFSPEELFRVLEGRGELARFAAGEVIFSPTDFRRAVGIFLKGRAQAQKTADGRTVVLNRFEPSMMFGAAAVFRQAQEYVSEVAAKTPCRVLFLTDEELREIFRQDFRAAENYIGFLSQRIAFLNRKIDSFTKSSAEEKLALHLHDQCLGRQGEVFVPCSPTALSRELGISRATVYRALEQFCRLGYVRREGNRLWIPDAQEFLRQREPEE